MLDAWPIASKVFAVSAVMGAGIAARRVGWLTREADQSLMRLAVNVMLPCLFFHRVITDPPAGRWADVVVPPLVGFATTAVGFVVAALAAVGFRRWARLGAAPQRRAFTLCTGMYNYGYVPLPIALAMFPDAVTTLIVHNVGVELALWTLGLLIISGHIGRDWWRRVVNPPMVAISVALLVAFSGGARFVPNLVRDATGMMGQTAIPLGLVLSGAVIYDLWGEGDWRAEWRALALSSLLRVVLLPAAFLLFARYGGLSESLRQVVMLQAAMPAAIFPIVLTKLYGQDSPTAFRIVVGTTLLGLITIPLWIAVGCWYLDIVPRTPG